MKEFCIVFSSWFLTLLAIVPQIPNNATTNRHLLLQQTGTKEGFSEIGSLLAEAAQYPRYSYIRGKLRTLRVCGGVGVIPALSRSFMM